jgi:hypothetical protein
MSRLNKFVLVILCSVSLTGFSLNVVAGGGHGSPR